jgi:hypothetical protein
MIFLVGFFPQKKRICDTIFLSQGGENLLQTYIATISFCNKSATIALDKVLYLFIYLFFSPHNSSSHSCLCQVGYNILFRARLDAMSKIWCRVKHSCEFCH